MARHSICRQCRSVFVCQRGVRRFLGRWWLTHACLTCGYTWETIVDPTVSGAWSRVLASTGVEAE